MEDTQEILKGKVKEEPSTSVEAISTKEDGLDSNEKRVLEWAKSCGDKVFYNSDIEKEFSMFSKQERVGILNLLIAKGCIAVQQITGKNQLVYKYKSSQPSALNIQPKAAMDNEEKILYNIIKEAGNKGIWMRDIRFKSQMLPNQLNKLLKSLENKKVIKAVKSVSAYKKKVYMLYDLEPDSALTGGSWYSDQDFESEFVDVLNEQCYRYLIGLKKKAKENLKGLPKYKKGPMATKNMSSAVAKDVWKYIKELGISKIPLSEEDIKTILDTLVYDGKVDKKCLHTGDYSYRAIQSLLPPGGPTTVPCGICPAVYRCHMNTILTSIECTHLSDWTKRIYANKKDRPELTY